LISARAWGKSVGVRSLHPIAATNNTIIAVAHRIRPNVFTVGLLRRMKNRPAGAYLRRFFRFVR
jgi:hypothetical protein